MAVLTSPRTVRTDTSARNKGLIRHALDTPLASLYLILTTTGLLTGLGVLMVLSASSVYAEVDYGDPYYFAKRQVMFLVIGLGLAWQLTRLSPRALRSIGADVDWFLPSRIDDGYGLREATVRPSKFSCCRARREVSRLSSRRYRQRTRRSATAR